MCSTAKADAGSPRAALPDVAGEIIAQLSDLDLNQASQPLFDLPCTITLDHGESLKRTVRTSERPF